MKAVYKTIVPLTIALCALLTQCSFDTVSGVKDGGGTSIEVVGVRGVVVDKNARPAVSASMVMRRAGTDSDSDEVRGSTATKEDGSFFIPEAGSGSYYLQASDGSGNRAGRCFAIAVGAGGADVDTLTLRETGSVSVDVQLNVTATGYYSPYLGITKNSFNVIESPHTVDTVQAGDTPVLRLARSRIVPDTYAVDIWVTYYDGATIGQSMKKYSIILFDTIVVVGEGEHVCLPDMVLSAQRNEATAAAFKADSEAYVSLCRKCGVDEAIPPGAVNTMTWRIQALNIAATKEVCFNDITQELGQLDHLREVRLSNVNGGALPEVFCTMKRLTYLVVDNGELTMIPSAIALLPKLTIVGFDSQQLSALPAFLDDLPPGQFQVVSLKNNPIIISSWEDQRRVNEVWARVGRFSILPMQQDDFRVVRKLLDENGYGNEVSNGFLGTSFSGRVTTIYLPPELPLHRFPQELDALDSLKMFVVGRHSLTSIPEWFSKCRALERLELPNGKLTLLPGFLANLSDLRFLNVANNRLTEVPKWIGNLEPEPFLDLMADFSCNRITPNAVKYTKPICLVEPQLSAGVGEPDETLLARDLEVAENLILSHKPNTYYYGFPFTGYNHYIRIKNDRIYSIGLSLSKYSYDERKGNADGIGLLIAELSKLDSLKIVYLEVARPESFASFDSLLKTVSARLPLVTDLVLNSPGSRIEEFPESFFDIMPSIRRIGLQYQLFKEVPANLKNRSGLESVDLFYNPIVISNDEDRAWMNKYCKIASVEYGNPLVNIHYEPEITWEKSVEYAKGW